MLIWEYVKAVFGQWWPLMSCAAFTFIAIWAGLKKKSDKWLTKGSVILAIIFLFVVAPYLAWKDQYDKAQSESVYVETHLGPAFLSQSPSPQPTYFPDGEQVTVELNWTRTGASIATDVFGNGKVYVEPDISMPTQRKITKDFQAQFDELVSTRKKEQMEGPTLGFSDESKSLHASTQPGTPIMDKSLKSKLWDGTEILYVVSSVSYRTESGSRYEGHYCQWLEPFSVGDSRYRGKPLPDPEPNLFIQWHSCGVYSSLARK